MACGWFMDEVDLSGCRVPIAGEFYKWPWWERRHDRSEGGDQDEGEREAGEDPRTRATGNYFLEF